MLNSKFLRCAIALTFATTAVACGDDDGAGPTDGDQLSETEAQALAGLVFNLAVNIFNSTDPDVAAMASAQSLSGGFPEQTITFDEESYTCPAGGSVVVDGSVTLDTDTDGETGDFDMDIRQRHDDCVSTATNGQTFVLNADPEIDTAFTGNFTPTVADVAGSWTGGIAWTSGSRSGTCSMDFAVDVSIDNQTGGLLSVDNSGTICGVSVDFES